MTVASLPAPAIHQAIGIDPAVKGISIVLLKGREYDWHWFEPPKSKRGMDTWGKTEALMEELRCKLGNGELAQVPTTVPVFIESPMVGPNARTTLDLAGVFALVRDAFHGRSFKTFPVASSTWKKDILGQGNANKERVKELLLLAHPELPATERDDFYDAYCIAQWGRRSLEMMGAG